MLARKEMAKHHISTRIVVYSAGLIFWEYCHTRERNIFDKQGHTGDRLSEYDELDDCDLYNPRMREMMRCSDYGWCREISWALKWMDDGYESNGN